MLCKKCGIQLVDNSKFCNVCGEQVESNNDKNLSKNLEENNSSKYKRRAWFWFIAPFSGIILVLILYIITGFVDGVAGNIIKLILGILGMISIIFVPIGLLLGFNSIKKVKNTSNENISRNPNSFCVASASQRLINYILDEIFFIIFCFIIGLLVGLLSNGEFVDNDNTDIIFRLLGIILSIFYYIFFESIWQATPGKLITKTMVIKKDGTKPNFICIAGRTLARLIPFEAFSFLTGDRPIGWHDYLSNTLVVPKNYKSENGNMSTNNANDRHNNIVIVIIVAFFAIVFIVGMLSTSAIISLSSARSKARDAKAVADMKTMQAAFELYAIDNGNYPDKIIPGQDLKYDGDQAIKIPEKIKEYENICPFGQYEYYPSEDKKSYQIKFCLENEVDEYKRGENVISGSTENQ